METQPSTTIFTPKISYVDFAKNIKKLDFIDSLMMLQKFSALMKNQTSLGINIEFELHPTPIQHRILLSRHCISFLSKEIILNCKRSSEKLGEIELIKLTQQYEVMKTDLSEFNPEADDSWLWVLRATNLQHYYLRTPATVIARYYYLFTTLLKKDPALGNILNQAMGLDVHSIIKIGFCAYCVLTTNTFFTKDRLVNTSVANLKNLLTSETVDKFIELFSADQAKFSKESKKYGLKKNHILLKKYEFNLLKRFPIVETDSSGVNEKHIIPSIGDFIYSFSEGLYYAFLDKLREKDKKNLFNRFGAIFEEYIGALLRSYNIDLLSRCKLHSELEYNIGKRKWKSADWTLVSDEHIFQIECKKRKPDQYSRAGISEKKLGVNKLISDISLDLDKLLKKEAHIKNNFISSISYGDQKIINLIVYLDEMFSMNQYARSAITKKMKEPADNFYILGCHEFELLCQLCRNQNAGLSQCLPEMEIIPVYQIDFLNGVFSQFTESLKELC